MARSSWNVTSIGEAVTGRKASRRGFFHVFFTVSTVDPRGFRDVSSVSFDDVRIVVGIPGCCASW